MKNNILDKDLENILMKISSASIDEIEEACAKVGVLIKNDSGLYRSTYDVLIDLANAFPQANFGMRKRI